MPFLPVVTASGHFKTVGRPATEKNSIRGWLATESVRPRMVQWPSHFARDRNGVKVKMDLGSQESVSRRPAARLRRENMCFFCQLGEMKCHDKIKKPDLPVCRVAEQAEEEEDILL